MNDRERVIDSVARHAPWMNSVDVDGGRWDGALTWKRNDSVKRCDFCCDTEHMENAKSYDADEVVVRTLYPPQVEKITQVIARGAWGACPSCAECIDADARDRLLQRMFDSRVGAFDAETPPERREQVRGMQRDSLRRTLRAFYRARK